MAAGMEFEPLVCYEDESPTTLGAVLDSWAEFLEEGPPAYVDAPAWIDSFAEEQAAPRAPYNAEVDIETRGLFPEVWRGYVLGEEGVLFSQLIEEHPNCEVRYLESDRGMLGRFLIKASDRRCFVQCLNAATRLAGQVPEELKGSLNIPIEKSTKPTLETASTASTLDPDESESQLERRVHFGSTETRDIPNRRDEAVVVNLIDFCTDDIRESAMRPPECVPLTVFDPPKMLPLILAEESQEATGKFILEASTPIAMVLTNTHGRSSFQHVLRARKAGAAAVVLVGFRLRPEDCPPGFLADIPILEVPEEEVNLFIKELQDGKEMRVVAERTARLFPSRPGDSCLESDEAEACDDSIQE